MSRSTVAVILIGLLVLSGAAACLFWETIPGTFYRDANGFPHGTGRYTYHYRAGPVMLIEDYRRGKLSRSEWFKPDGTSIMVLRWGKGPCVGIYLREDGTTKSKMTYVDEVAEGPATYYADDGKTVIGEAIFSGGVRTSGYDPRKKSE